MFDIVGQYTEITFRVLSKITGLIIDVIKIIVSFLRSIKYLFAVFVNKNSVFISCRDVM